MTEQKKDSSSQENEKSSYPAQILTVEEVKAELITQWNKKVDIPRSDVFVFLVDALAEATAQNYALCSQEKCDIPKRNFFSGYTHLGFGKDLQLKKFFIKVCKATTPKEISFWDVAFKSLKGEAK